MSNSSTEPTATPSTPLIPKSNPNPRPKLLSHDESLAKLPWQTDNDYIRGGYRDLIPSIKGCLWSAIGYVHNETVNIHTHSIGALFFLALIPLHLLPTHFPSFKFNLHIPFFHAHTNIDITKVATSTPIPPTIHDKLALTTYLLCAVSCLGLSSWFHTVSCHSRPVCDLAHRGDYIGIVILIVGSILPGMYYSFYDNPTLQLVYMGGILTAGITSAYIVLSPHHRSHRWHRTLTFIGLGLSAVIPTTHILLTQGLAHARDVMSLDLVLAGGASYIFGALLYAARLPEKLSPGRFDYFGSSHQIFHVFVLVGAGFQYAALRGMVWGRSMAIGK